jgi:pSer/pThr/pTyr-binding forkhead associated (FHA) protein
MFSALLSVLAKKFAAGDLNAFRSAHPSAWLVWEPGAWKPPTRGGTMQIPAPGLGLANTPVPGAGAEALAWNLTPKHPQAEIALGRGDNNDVVINDATLSSRHLVFSQDSLGWKVRDAGSTNGSAVDGAPLLAGTTLRLRAGSVLRAGQVKLTFLDAGGMFARLKSVAAGTGR